MFSNLFLFPACFQLAQSKKREEPSLKAYSPTEANKEIHLAGLHNSEKYNVRSRTKPFAPGRMLSLLKPQQYLCSDMRVDTLIRPLSELHEAFCCSSERNEVASKNSTFAAVQRLSVVVKILNGIRPHFDDRLCIEKVGLYLTFMNDPFHEQIYFFTRLIDHEELFKVFDRSPRQHTKYIIASPTRPFTSGYTHSIYLTDR